MQIILLGPEPPPPPPPQKANTLLVDSAQHRSNSVSERPGLLIEFFQYLIDGEQPAGNLDGYEPEFFMPILPKDMWMEKKYTVQLTITPEILAKAQGGIIFYFCHIHAG